MQLGAPGESNTHAVRRRRPRRSTAPAYTDADVAFVQGMIPHHQQALEMTAMVERRGPQTATSALMAERMEVSQTDEIAQLEEWLNDRGEDVPGRARRPPRRRHAALMPGMLTDEELAQLERPTATRFDRLFLQYMIRHHEGAVLMVEQLLTERRGWPGVSRSSSSPSTSTPTSASRSPG